MELDISDDTVRLSERLVHLSLRGTLFTVPADAADRIPDCRLARALRGSLIPPPLVDPRGGPPALYFNRNPVVFHMVLDALTAAKVIPPSDSYLTELFEQEMRFWGVTSKRLRDAEASAAVSLVPRDFGQLQVVAPSGGGAASHDGELPFSFGSDHIGDAGAAEEAQRHRPFRPPSSALPPEFMAPALAGHHGRHRNAGIGFSSES